MSLMRSRSLQRPAGDLRRDFDLRQDKCEDKMASEHGQSQRAEATTEVLVSLENVQKTKQDVQSASQGQNAVMSDVEIHVHRPKDADVSLKDSVKEKLNPGSVDESTMPSAGVQQSTEKTPAEEPEHNLMQFGNSPTHKSYVTNVTQPVTQSALVVESDGDTNIEEQVLAEPGLVQERRQRNPNIRQPSLDSDHSAGHGQVCTLYNLIFCCYCGVSMDQWTLCKNE